MTSFDIIQVTANFKIRNAERDLDPYFSFSLTSGSIPSKGSLEVKVTYTPVAAALQSSEYYDIVTVSGNTTRLTCLGMGMGRKA